LRRSMVSMIPFNSNTPIVNIPPLGVQTKVLTFLENTQEEIYKTLVSTSYNRLKEIPTSAPVDIMSKVVFSLVWHYRHIISFVPALAHVAAKASADDIEDRLFKRTAHKGHDERYVCNNGDLWMVLEDFYKAFPEFRKDFLPLGASVASMSRNQLADVLAIGAPKLA
jgi:hypothetical protein